MHFQIVAPVSIDYHRTLPNLWMSEAVLQSVVHWIGYKSLSVEQVCWNCCYCSPLYPSFSTRGTFIVTYSSFVTCQDNCGIQTGPDPFSSLPNDKEKKRSIHARLTTLVSLLFIYMIPIACTITKFSLYLFKLDSFVALKPWCVYHKLLPAGMGIHILWLEILIICSNSKNANKFSGFYPHLYVGAVVKYTSTFLKSDQYHFLQNDALIYSNKSKEKFVFYNQLGSYK